MLDVRFLNHACFIYEGDGIKIVCDPWFQDEVFNGSWTLLKETPDMCKELEDVTHICISHEHPDHLHFGTLRQILARSKSTPKLIFPKRSNAFVKSSIRKIGFETVFIERSGEKLWVSEDVSIAYFGERSGHDNTIVIDTPDGTIINQNDHYTPKNLVKSIKAQYKNIQYFFTQFSLAGYYGNRDDPQKIKNDGTEFHLSRLLEYSIEFAAKVTVPFASYVYFSHEYNKYLNEHIVSPKRVHSELTRHNIPHQIVWYGDKILVDQQERDLANKSALDKLLGLFDISNNKFNCAEVVSAALLAEKLEKRLNKIGALKRSLITFGLILRTFLKGQTSAPALLVFFEDTQEALCVNLITGEAKVSCNANWSKADLICVSSHFEFMIKMPFGADTFNIAACHMIKNAKGEFIQHLLFLSNRDHYA